MVAPSVEGIDLYNVLDLRQQAYKCIFDDRVQHLYEGALQAV